ncbi:ANR family transcriptional regulator [Vibrio maritimus]|uniref:ANR family transcriptional regulator n=1 Tax=Vibrio maritimus TaxID=990268 RepID=UPI0040677D26
MYTPNQYKHYAEQACEFEKQESWKLAREMWDLAEASAQEGSLDRFWAHSRATFCAIREQRTDKKNKLRYTIAPKP